MLSSRLVLANKLKASTSATSFLLASSISSASLAKSLSNFLNLPSYPILEYLITPFRNYLTVGVFLTKPRVPGKVSTPGFINPVSVMNYYRCARIGSDFYSYNLLYASLGAMTLRTYSAFLVSYNSGFTTLSISLAYSYKSEYSL